MYVSVKIHTPRVYTVYDEGHCEIVFNNISPKRVFKKILRLR